jgi:Uma2 family endonuclease
LSTTLTKATATRLLEGETRILARDVPWALYEELVDSLHEGSPIRLAYDGKDMELMTTSKDHEQVGWLMARFAVAIIEELRIKFVPCGRSTWKEAKARRGIEADACYILAPAKVETVRAFRAAKLKDEFDYPMADLAVEVDISRPAPQVGFPPLTGPQSTRPWASRNYGGSTRTRPSSRGWGRTASTCKLIAVAGCR